MLAKPPPSDESSTSSQDGEKGVIAAKDPLRYHQGYALPQAGEPLRENLQDHDRYSKDEGRAPNWRVAINRCTGRALAVLSVVQPPILW